MSADFDPYHKWLGIPREEQPPNLYRLLGIRIFESDPDVIANASDQRMAHLKNFAIGQHSALSEDLLNEVARAKVWLLHPAKRPGYDRKLRDQLAGLPPEGARSEVPPEIRALHAAWDSAPANQTATVEAQPANAISDDSHEWIPSQHAHDTESLPTSLATTTSKLSVSSRTRARTPTVITGFVILAISGIMGLAAGYFVLCVYDIRYDFLHLLKVDPPKIDNAAPQMAVPPPPPRKLNPGPAPKVPIAAIPQAPPAGPKRQGHSIKRPPDKAKVNPFANFPPVLPLPDWSAHSDPIPLASVPTNGLEDFDLSLAHVFNTPLSIERRAQDSNPWNWVVHGGADNKKDVATFLIKNDELLFNWYPTQDRSAVVALRNSVLRMQANGFDRFVALREPIQIEPYVIDIEKPVDRGTCVCNDLPEPETLRLDILDVANSPKFKAEGGGLLGLKVGAEVVLHFDDANDISIHVKFAKIATDNRLAIEFRPRYHLPSRPQDELEFKSGPLKLKNLRSLAAERKDDAKVQADLQSLERTANVSAAAHKKMTFKYRFYSVVGGHEIVLATIP